MRTDNTQKYWKVEFFPNPGERHSPEVYIGSIQPVKDRAKIYKKLKTLETIQLPTDWPNVKRITHDGERFYQMTIGAHRLYLCPHSARESRAGKIVVVYACRKRGRKANPKDFRGIVRNLRAYWDLIQ